MSSWCKFMLLCDVWRRFVRVGYVLCAVLVSILGLLMDPGGLVVCLRYCCLWVYGWFCGVAVWACVFFWCLLLYMRFGCCDS